MPVTLVNMSKTNMTTLLTMVLLANGVWAANMQADKEGMIRRESSTSSLSIMSAGDTREAGVLEVDAAGVTQYTLAGEMMRGASKAQALVLQPVRLRFLTAAMQIPPARGDRLKYLSGLSIHEEIPAEGKPSAYDMYQPC
jgi:hypothetical protein